MAYRAHAHTAANRIIAARCRAVGHSATGRTGMVMAKDIDDSGDERRMVLMRARLSCCWRVCFGPGPHPRRRGMRCCGVGSRTRGTSLLLRHIRADPSTWPGFVQPELSLTSMDDYYAGSATNVRTASNGNCGLLLLRARKSLNPVWFLHGLHLAIDSPLCQSSAQWPKERPIAALNRTIPPLRLLLEHSGAHTVRGQALASSGSTQQSPPKRRGLHEIIAHAKERERPGSRRCNWGICCYIYEV